MSISAPKIYTISAGQSFVDQLVAGVLERVGSDPISLSETIILLPNRRAARSLREAFLRRTEGKPMLLPQMRPIGDVEEGEIEFLGAGAGISGADIIPPIEPVKRQAYLTKLVQQWLGRTLNEPMAPAQAWRFAGELAHFLDQVETEDLDLQQLESLVPDGLAQHWQLTLDFLKIISEAWPSILFEDKTQNPASYRNQTIRAVAEIFRSSPPDRPVIAAGSTGSIPATAELLSIVSRLPNGAVVLPGFETDVDDEVWNHISDNHPQAAMKRLLNYIGASRHEVESWTSGAALNHHSRLQLLRDSMLPSALTGRWRARHKSNSREDVQALSGLRALVAPGRREEAEAIAVALREVLETPAKTAALVTPDRQLALYVRAALKRWGVDVDDSGGDKAINTQPGRLLALLASAVSDDFGPLSTLSLFQHPLVSAGLERSAFLAFTRRLDAAVLRGVRPAGGLNGLIVRGESCVEDKRSKWSSGDQEELKRILAVMRPIEQLLRDAVPLSHALETHLSVVEDLCGNEKQDGKNRLWRGEAGQALADHIYDLMQSASLLTVDSAAGYGAFFNELMQSAMVRPSWNKHPRLAIWGPLEARLQQADLMIIGGLNEGVWPAEPSIDPWMSNDMRLSFGLPSLDRRIGQAAHDFMLAVSAPDVLLTRSEKTDGTPTIPSRWWLRIEACLGKPLASDQTYLNWAMHLDQVPAVKPIAPPRPKPPLAARPRSLSVTQVQEWMRDPYALYAKKILGLSARDPIDDKPNAATKGNLLHEALELFLKEDGPVSGDAGKDRLIQIGRDVFKPVISQPAVYAFWWPRFERIADWFVGHHQTRSQTWKVALIEGWSSHSFQTAAGAQPFTLEARADRIDQNRETGHLEIIDYKTGNIPTRQQIEAGYAPQLPLEGLLAQLGAFEGVPAQEVDDLVFWKITGGELIQEMKRPVRDVSASIEQAREGLLKLVEAFDNVGTAYLSNPSPDIAGHGDFDHLARVKEWRNRVNDDGLLAGDYQAPKDAPEVSS